MVSPMAKGDEGFFFALGKPVFGCNNLAVFLNRVLQADCWGRAISLLIRGAPRKSPSDSKKKRGYDSYVRDEEQP